MKTVFWTNRSQNDTNITAKGFASIKEAKEAVDNFCNTESAKLGGTCLNTIIADSGFAYDDEPGVYHFSTDCVTASKTECTYQTAGFRFTVTGKKDDSYIIQIGYVVPWGERVVVDGVLVMRDDMWRLTKATYEDDHDEATWRQFLNDLLLIRNAAYPEAVRYYQANRQPDIFEIADKILANRKAI